MNEACGEDNTTDNRPGRQAMVINTWALALCGWLLANSCMAATTLQLRTETDGNHYHYQWQDLQQQPQQLEFVLTANPALSPYRPYRPEMMSTELQQALLQAASKLPAGITLQFDGHPRHGRYQLKGGSATQRAAALQQLQQRQQQARQQFIERHHYAEIRLSDGQRGLIPDHLYYISASIPALAPVAATLKLQRSGANPRPTAEWLLGWVQGIPYETMDNRFGNNSADFRPPLTVLQEHRGDCDAKAALLAALLRARFPRLGLTLVYLPEHALLGIDLPHSRGEQYLQWQGQRMLLAEVAGPALLPLGQLSERSRTLIAAGQYSQREVPRLAQP